MSRFKRGLTPSGKFLPAPVQKYIRLSQQNQAMKAKDTKRGGAAAAGPSATIEETPRQERDQNPSNAQSPDANPSSATLASIQLQLEELSSALPQRIAKALAEHLAAQNAKNVALEEEIKETKTELKQVKEELGKLKAALAAGSPAATPAAQQHFRPDELRVKVKPESVATVGAIIQDAIQAERPGARVQFSLRPIQPKRGQQAAAQAGRTARTIMALRMHPADRQWFLALGGVLRRKEVLLDDSLTPSGVELRKVRGRVFGALLAEAKKSQDRNRPVKRVRWEQGVEVSYLHASDQRVRYDFSKSPTEQGLPEAVAAAVQAALAAAPPAGQGDSDMGGA